MMGGGYPYTQFPFSGALPLGTQLPQDAPPIDLGQPIQFGPDNRGPPGSNLFVFHLPNTLTNAQLYDIFAPFGPIVSSQVAVDKHSGAHKGFGCVLGGYHCRGCRRAWVRT